MLDMEVQVEVTLTSRHRPRAALQASVVPGLVSL